MTTLRTAAQQALEALKHSLTFVVIEAKRAVRNDCADETIREAETAEHQHRAAITALKAALVEDAMQKFTDVNQELQAVLGCDHCNQPLYAAIKCRVCGRVTEPVQEPVAWIHTDPDKPRVKFLEWRENEPGYRGDWIKTPLYTTPQRKPLTREQAIALWADKSDGPSNGEIVSYCRAIERAHGITS